jgi:disulfide bond formation protein DsbB
MGFAVALVTMLGSLYYSQIAHFEPCELCWFQRIALYPMSIIMLVAAIRRDVLVKFYVVPVLVVGALISIYHYQYEWFPHQKSAICSLDVGESPCNITWFRQFGFMSLAYMALSSALVIITLVLVARRDIDEDLSEV